MSKKIRKLFRFRTEQAILLALSVAFIFVLINARQYATNLRQTVSANAAGINLDATPVLEVERVRALYEAHVADARSFFLLGSKALMDKQKAEKEAFVESLSEFEKHFNLPEIPEIVKRLQALVQQEQEVFDQAMDFREKQTESKIVGQFYQGKTVPIRAQLNESLDKIVGLLDAELNRARTEVRSAGLDAEAQIPKGLVKFTEIVATLFLALAVLVILMMRMRLRQERQRSRLVEEAKNAIIARDEVISAISRDLHPPLKSISEFVEGLAVSPAKDESGETIDRVEMIKSTVVEINGYIRDICDQKKSELGTLSIRIEQLAIEEILEEARLMLAPIAKQRDIRLQFEPVNPPLSAFADRERVLRIFSNLIGNAIKFSQRHSRVVVKARADQQFVFISVSDNGPGIPEKNLPGIFSDFWQANSTSSQGAGIGLAVVKTLVEAQGGSVKAESLVGHGATFTFTLPRRRPVGFQVKSPTSMAKRAALIQAALKDQGPNL